MPHFLSALDAATPLADVLALAVPGDVLGVWIDLPPSSRPLPLRIPASPRWISLLLSSDLASLASRAPRIIVAREGAPWIAPRAALLRGRGIEIEGPDECRLHPLDGIAPEAVLMERRSLRRIAASRVRYREPG